MFEQVYTGTWMRIQSLHVHTWSEQGLIVKYAFQFVYARMCMLCTLYRHVCTWFIMSHTCIYMIHTRIYMVHLCSFCSFSVHGSSLFSLVHPFLLKSIPGGMLFVHCLYSAVPALDNAMVQELAVWYRHCS